MGAFPVVVTEDPAVAHRVTSKCLSRHPVPFVEVGEDEKLNNLSIVFTRGDLWKSFRFAWQPMFHSGSLQAFVALMRNKAQRLIGVLEGAAAGGEEVDIVTVFNEMTMEVVGETAYGVDFNILPRTHPAVSSTKDGKKNQTKPTRSDGSEDLQQGTLEDETRQLVTAMKMFFKGTAQMGAGAVAFMMMFPTWAPLIKWVANAFPTKQYADVLKARLLIRDISARLLLQAKEEQVKTSGAAAATNVQQQTMDQGRKGVQPGSFIHLLTHSKNKVTNLPFSDFEIIANSFFFLVSGNETTSTALTMAGK